MFGMNKKEGRGGEGRKNGKDNGCDRFSSIFGRKAREKLKMI